MLIPLWSTGAWGLVAALTLTAACTHTTKVTMHDTQARAPLLAEALKPGDTIQFVAPAGELDEPRIRRAAAALEARGFKVLIPPTLFRTHGYLAGTDAQRAAELNDAFNNPEVDAVFPGTGGYGCTRILPLLDFDAIRRNPKVFIGFSDITALHIAIHQRTGLVTFHTPNPQWGLGSEDGLHPLADTYWWQTLLASSYHADEAGFAYDFAGHDDVPAMGAMTTGRATGRLIGGNLSVIVAMMGTPDEIDTAGRVLFIEDVGEAPYKVDRMLRQLDNAGKLEDLAGALLGSFTARKNDAPLAPDEWTVDDVLEQYFAHRSYPVLTRVPTGHIRPNVTLPVGGLVEVHSDPANNLASLRLVENPLQTTRSQP